MKLDLKKSLSRKALLLANLGLFFLLIAPLVLVFIFNYQPSVDQRVYGQSQYWPINSYTLTAALQNSLLGLREYYRLIPDKVNAGPLVNFNLVIDRNNLNQLNQNLPFSGRKSQIAQLHVAGKIFPVKVRYRGDSQWHWLYRHKSWRIEFENGDYAGLKTIDLVVPKTQSLIEEHLLRKWARAVGLSAPYSELVTLSVNSQWSGISFLQVPIGEDFFQPESLPKQVWAFDLNSVCLPGHAWKDSACWQLIYASAENPQTSVERADLQKFLDQIAKQQYANLDLESLALFFAFMSVLNVDHVVNLGLNIRLAQNANGAWTLIPYDLLRYGTVAIVDKKMSNVLFSHLSKQEIFRKKYTQAKQNILLKLSDQNIGEDIKQSYEKINYYIDFAIFNKIPAKYAYLGIDWHRTVFYIDTKSYQRSVKAFEQLTFESIKRARIAL